MLAPWKKSYDQPRQCIKKQRHHFANKGPSSQSYGFSSSHVWMWDLDHKEVWALKNWCFWTVVLDWLSVNSEGNQSWIFFRRTDTEAETPVFWSFDANSWLIGKVPDTGKDWGQKETRVSEDEIAGWHHWCNGHELGQTLGDGEGQGGLACCSPWGHKESDMAGLLNSSNNDMVSVFKNR